MSSRALYAVVAAMSIATLAIGLRAGAGGALHAAVVYGAPLPRGGGRAAWQLRTEEDDLHSRTAESRRFVATVTARGATRVVRGVTNADGVAELPFEAAGLSTGDRVELDVRDERGAVLARGAAVWPGQTLAPRLVEPARLRPSRVSGALRLSASILGGALAPGEPGKVWIWATADGEPPRDVHVEATPDFGAELTGAYAPSRDPACTGDVGVVGVVARGMSCGLTLHATDALGREGDWYGGLPLAPGAFLVTAPTVSPSGPVRVAVRSASARTLAYVEVDDDRGRVAAVDLPLTGEPARGEATFDLRTPGRYFLVVSSDADGAEQIAGATRALPLWIGPGAPCEAALAGVAAASFPRFVALDGFVAARAKLAARHETGRLVAFAGLGIGALLETLLLLRAAREGRRRMTRLKNEMLAQGEPREAANAVAPRRDALDVLVFLGVSLLGFALLFALVVAFATK